MRDEQHCFTTTVHPPHDWLSGNVLYRCVGIRVSGLVHPDEAYQWVREENA